MVAQTDAPGTVTPVSTTAIKAETVPASASALAMAAAPATSTVLSPTSSTLGGMIQKLPQTSTANPAPKAPTIMDMPAPIAAITRPSTPMSSRNTSIAGGAPTAPKTSVTGPTYSRRKRSVWPLIGWVAAGGAGVGALGISSVLRRDVNEYNAKGYAGTQAELTYFNELKSTIDSRKTLLNVAVGAAMGLTVVSIIGLITRKSRQSSRTTLWIEPLPQGGSVGLVRHF